MEDQYVGLILALASSVLIGSSFIITKKGLIDAANRNHGGLAGADTYSYLRNPTWWAGMVTMTLGEAANFAAYAYAQANLVTPLGAGSVVVGAILSSIFLGETMGTEGKIGVALSIIGSVIIILHISPEKDPSNMDELIGYAVEPPFLIYSIIVVGLTVWLIFKVAPTKGKSNMLVYVTICSLVGSITVMASKAFGLALKLTFAGNNQFTRVSTYFFMLVVVGAVLVQMNYFNKALDVFSTNKVTPVYYVLFTTATLVASALLYKSFYEASTVEIISSISGFIVIFIGVFMINSKRSETRRSPSLHGVGISGEGIPMVRRNSFNFPSTGLQKSKSRMSISEHHLLRTFNDPEAQTSDEDDE